MVRTASLSLSETFDAVLSRKAPGDAFLAGAISLSYGQLRECVHQTLNLFASRGLKPGDRIVVASSDELETSTLYLAALRYGLCTAVIDPSSSISEAVLLMDAVEPKAAFVDGNLARGVSAASSDQRAQLFLMSEESPRSHASGVPNLIRLKKHTADLGEMFQACRSRESASWDEAAVQSEDETALVLFTSGTTSRPKGVELTFANLRAQFDTFSRQYRFDEGSRILNHLPLHHTDGLNQGPAVALYCGATWIRPEGPIANRLDRLLETVRRESVTHFITVPTVLALVDQLPATYESSFRVDGFQFIGSTAGRLDENLWRRIESRFGVTVVNSYGLTETVSEALYCGPDAFTRRVGSIGRPVDCDARIVDVCGKDVALGSIGELILRGTNVMKGYLNDPESTSEVLREGWFYTGDLAQQDEDGYYYIAGRKKNLIIRGGINVYPDDVTNAVMELEEVLEAATIGVEDPVLGEKIVVCVTPSGMQSGIVEAVVKHCKARLAPERRPDHVLDVQMLPRGPSGKVVVNDLRQLVQRKLTGATATLDGSVEDQVLALSAAVLGVPSGSISSGTSSKSLDEWDSLAHLALVSAYERHFSVAFAAEDIMNMSDIASAVALISAKRKGAGK